MKNNLCKYKMFVFLVGFAAIAAIIAMFAAFVYLVEPYFQWMTPAGVNTSESIWIRYAWAVINIFISSISLVCVTVLTLGICLQVYRFGNYLLSRMMPSHKA